MYQNEVDLTKNETIDCCRVPPASVTFLSLLLALHFLLHYHADAGGIFLVSQYRVRRCFLSVFLVLVRAQTILAACLRTPYVKYHIASKIALSCLKHELLTS